MFENHKDGQLRRSSLGRMAFIGELYNARTESFSSRSLLKRTLPDDFIECRDIAQMEFDYRFTDSASERFHLLKVEAELQLSILLGLVSVSGSGSFLTEEEESEKSICCSLMCNTTTVCEKFFASFADIMHHIDLTALEDPESTHVVSEVTWGANCLLSLVATAKSVSDKEELKPHLSGKMEMLKSILSVSGKGTLETKKLISESSDDIHIKVCADIVPDGGWPTSIEGFCQFVMDTPKLLKRVNKGKGKPLYYVMIPLNSFRKLAKLTCGVQNVVKSIDQSFLLSTVYLLEDIAQSKRKLNNLLSEMTTMQKYVKEDDLKTARKHQQDLTVKESELKLLISEQWIHIRSGNISLMELIKKIESYKNRTLRLVIYDEYIESTAGILKKLAGIRYYISLGIVYLGKEESFDSVLSRNLSCEFLVLLTSSEMKQENEELYILTFHHFLTEASDPRPNTKYVIVDFDYQRQQTFMEVNVYKTSIFHLKGSNILSEDIYSDFLADLTSNFIRLKKEAKVTHITHKPGNRVPLEMICPGFQKGTCSTDLLSWKCIRCRANVEYGFDQFFYCLCGKSRTIDTEYRCYHLTHGNVFLEGDYGFIQSKLASLKPLKEINVLIIGSSGVGKSTWINSIVNYLNFETLDRARKEGAICTIPLRFTAYDPKSSKKHIVEVGEENKNEITTTGQSGTQISHTYSFIWEGQVIRLIDTPGVGDTRGIQQDKINLKNIINHIGHLKELHGVCILLKANDNRINTIFSYCLKELLVHLHKSVTKNIVFCFTYARNSLYTPGQTSALLETLIRQLGAGRDLPLGYHNMFCLDNEAFIFLCTLKNSEITYDKKLIESFSQSWKISLDETKRLFNTIKSFEPHALTDTLTLVASRFRIMSLTRPIAEISKTIQINISQLEKNRQELMTTNQTLENLSKNLNFTETRLQAIPLEFPRTVCTSPSCVSYYKYTDEDVQAVEYKTHCHFQCLLKNVEAMTVNNADLRGCDIMNKSGKCRKCGCGWEKHMHMTYSQRRVQTERISKTVLAEIMQEKSEKERKESIVKELEVLIEKYKKEQEFIIQVSVKCGMFLRRNAITLYNDSVAAYMEYLIEEEENKPHKTKTETNLLESLKEMLSHYHAEVAVLTEVLKKGETSDEELTPEQMLELEKQLYSLELTGEEIKKSVECNRLSSDRMMQYLETPLQIVQKQPQKEANKAERLLNWVKEKNCELFKIASK